MSETAAVGTSPATGYPEPCAADCAEHAEHRQMVLGPDGNLYPAPVYPEPKNGPVRRVFRKIATGPLGPLALLLCAALPVWYVLANNPTDDQPDLGACAFKLVTGFDCPGCGGTRALWYLLHGDLPEAARYHAIAVFAAPFIVYMYLSWAWRTWFPNARLKLPKLAFGPNTISVFLAVWGVFWVVRNLPWAPFTGLYV
ncbi:hypothetical protein Afil01_04090 [Actinorhabdospora filicis]|uniref:DUF2752 domain-containing protein n=1 Tax=Actinorhabdospora filicis TaxID=1785913 RepID=A0A9W6SGT9_9ACTN|nr:DUF2752 domain-containing protein [Actinorhabdospora filicis]GLZ75602.1 hypothetical protein Afil01_04090 [Actinorhabdospora filicis]